VKNPGASQRSSSWGSISYPTLNRDGVVQLRAGRKRWPCGSRCRCRRAAIPAYLRHRIQVTDTMHGRAERRYAVLAS
jgi:hypothetical protein